MTFVKSLETTFIGVAIAFSTCTACFGANEGSTNGVRIVLKVAHMGHAVSNELVSITGDQSVPQTLRDLAVSILLNHDDAGTNTYADIEAFFNSFAITNQPTISSNTLLIMRDTLETGISAKSKLETYISDINIEPDLRQISQLMLFYLNDQPAE